MATAATATALPVRPRSLASLDLLDTHSLFYKGHLYKGHCLLFGIIKGQSILLARKIRDKIVHGDKGH